MALRQSLGRHGRFPADAQPVNAPDRPAGTAGLVQELHQVVGDQVGHLQFLVGFRDPDLHGNLVDDALAQHRPRTFPGLFQVVFQAAAVAPSMGPHSSV